MSIENGQSGIGRKPSTVFRSLLAFGAGALAFAILLGILRFQIPSASTPALALLALALGIAAGWFASRTPGLAPRPASDRPRPGEIGAVVITHLALPMTMAAALPLGAL